MKKNLILVLTFLSVLGCEKKKETETEYLEVRRTFDIWGKNFEIIPVQQASPEIQELGKSVGFVRLIDGSSGSGFFISPNGLFLTNNHVVERNRCRPSKCEGVQIIRDFHQGGDNETFNDVEPLIQSKERDFAILQVKLPPGKTVPFFKLSLSSTKDLKNVAVLGHPAGAPLKFTPMEMTYKNESGYTLHGATFWGNSGSPLVDLDSKTAIGILSNISFGPDMIEKDGNFRVESGAIPLEVVTKTVQMVIKNFDITQPAVSLNQEITPNAVLNPLQQSILPITAEMAQSDSEKNSQILFGQFQGKNEKYFEALVVQLENSINGPEQLTSLLYEMTLFQRAKNYAVPISNSQYDRLIQVSKRASKSDLTAEINNLIDVYLNKMTPQTCVNNNKSKSWSTFHFSCSSPINPKGEDSYDLLNDQLNILLGKISSKEDRQKLFSAGISIFDLRSRLGPPSPAQMPKVQQALQDLANQVNFVGYAFKAEQLLVMLQNHPEWLDLTKNF